MIIPKLATPLKLIAKVFLVAISANLLLALLAGTYLLGYSRGLLIDQQETREKYLGFLPSDLSPTPTALPTKTPVPERIVTEIRRGDWGGPELWEAVNKRRKEFGVNPLSQRDELCTIASIRLNELLALGKLDNHEGFSNMSERRPDLKWIFDKYSNVAEFLAQGGDSAQETVSLWENTLGHRKLLTGGEYVWGCIYAQNTFAVAIVVF